MDLFTFHPAVETDLGQILDFIADDSFDAAVRMLIEFEDAFARLSRNPRMGRLRPDLTARDLRFWIVRRYLIAYDPNTKPMTVMMVVHGMRNPEEIASILGDR